MVRMGSPATFTVMTLPLPCDVGTIPGSMPLAFCPGESLRLGVSSGYFEPFMLDGSGAMNLVVPSAPRCGVTIHVQAFDATSCRVSNVVINTF